MSRGGDTRSLLFYATNEMNYVMFKPIHERLRRDPRIRMTFSGKYSGRGGVRELWRNAEAGDVRMMHTWISRHLKHDVYVTAAGRPRGRARHSVMIYHGVSMKNYFLVDVQDYDRHFIYGAYMRRRLIEEGFPADDEICYPMIGYPKIDCLVNGSLNADEIRASIGLDPGTPTVAYAPTHAHQGTCSIYLAGKKIIKTLADMGVNVLVKLHTHLHDPRGSKADWIGLLEADRSPNLFLATGHDSSPYLFVSDVLITDISAIGWEFALLDRPTIYYDAPELIEILRNTARKPDLDTWGRKAGTVVKDCRELRAAVEKALADPSDKSDIRKAMVADIYYKPGTATDRAVARMYEYLELDPP